MNSQLTWSILTGIKSQNLNMLHSPLTKKGGKIRKTLETARNFVPELVGGGFYATTLLCPLKSDSILLNLIGNNLDPFRVCWLFAAARGYSNRVLDLITHMDKTS